MKQDPAIVARTQERRRDNIARRNASIRSQFNHLYQVKRLRHDDCIEELGKEFHVSVRTIRKVIKSGI